MGKIDIGLKEWLEIPEIFADLFNGGIFHGLPTISPQDLMEKNSESTIIVKDKDDKTVYKQTFHDVVRMSTSNTGLITLCVENQEDISNIMPVRNMLYDSFMYMENIRRIQNENIKSGITPPLINGIESGQKLVPIITLVFYTGKERWKGPASLYELLDFPSPIPSELSDVINNYKIHIIDAYHMTDNDINNYHGDVQNLFKVLRCFNEHKSLHHLSGDTLIKYPATVEALGAIRKNRKYHELLKARKKVGVKDMRDIEDIWFEQGEKQGEKCGEKRGESRLSQLINLLFEQNRAEDVKRIANDKDYRNLLYKEFNIL